MGLYDAFRTKPFQTAYGENKTAVTVDVLEVGLILAFVLLAFSFLVVLPGFRHKERLYVTIRIVVSLFIGAVIILSNFGMEWEHAEIETKTLYKAFSGKEIEAHIAIKIGLRGVNITMKGVPDVNVKLDNTTVEKVDYNERFHWNSPWGLSITANINREFREAQYKGLPYAILWIAEYFTIDGENIRWGRSYRMAGFYTHIMLWTAFATWLITIILFFVVISYGALFLGITGGIMVIGNIIYGTLRWGTDLKIPFNSHAILEPSYGWCFYLSLLTGLACIILAVVIYIIDLINPTATASFFNIDILTTFEDAVLVKSKRESDEDDDEGIGSGEPQDIKLVEPNANANGEPRAEDGEEVYGNIETITKFRPRTRTGLGLTRRNPRAPRAAPRAKPPPPPADDNDEDDDNLYANVPRRGVTVKVTNPQYVEKKFDPL
ncbi:dual oxidase maturation factor 1-like [Dendronephthya gigantea]|uniref:dual oxidase maturation factor 1-like n=1 Tax=Dendronephthya gigantea TaxID=151771 RepID=UPI00106D2ED9|nr:dual oxidase maturation factor 1-like [Dendronephthya gigantea]